MEHPIDKAVRISGLGSVSALAKILGVTRAAVNQWRDEGRRVPAVHCPVIERLAGGEVRCEELNADVDWSYIRTTQSQPSPEPVHITALPIAHTIEALQEDRRGVDLGYRQPADPEVLS